MEGSEQGCCQWRGWSDSRGIPERFGYSPGGSGRATEDKTLPCEVSAALLYTEGKWKAETSRNSALEDKLVQLACGKVLNAIYEYRPQLAARNVVQAQTVFADIVACIFDDELYSTINETRELILGHSLNNRILIVYFTERVINTIRIISARPATKNEIKRYEKKSL